MLTHHMHLVYRLNHFNLVFWLGSGQTWEKSLHRSLMTIDLDLYLCLGMHMLRDKFLPILCQLGPD